MSTCRRRSGVLLGLAQIPDLASEAVRRLRARGSEPWRRLVSETNLGRALEFMSQPPDVEVLRDGNWVLGWMVGWRQEEGSSCRVMVRVNERGDEKTAWADLHDVRLPEYRGCPPTRSLPLLPRLPAGRMEQMTWSESGGGWNDQQGLREFAEPARADGATGRTSLVRAPWDAVGSETSRHRALPGIADSGRDHEVRTSGSRWTDVPASRRSGSRGGHEAGASLPSWWPSSTGPVPQPDVEPTRLLTLSVPRRGRAVAARHGGSTAY